MHINNLISVMEMLVYDWSASRLPTDYICLEVIVSEEEAKLATERLRITGANFDSHPKKSSAGVPGVEITLQNVLSFWVDTLRFWR